MNMVYGFSLLEKDYNSVTFLCLQGSRHSHQCTFHSRGLCQVVWPQNGDSIFLVRLSGGDRFCVSSRKSR